MTRRHRCTDSLPIVKIHFDEAYDKRNFRSASGVVVWGCRNEKLATKTVLHNYVPSPFAAEAYAGLEAIKLGILMGFRDSQIKGDSKTVIRKCQTTEVDKSVIGAIIRDIQDKCAHYQTIKFKYIPRK